MENKEYKNSAILELYEFEIKGYPTSNTPVNFDPIRGTENKECGIIEINIPGTSFNSQFKSSCDVIASDNKLLPDVSQSNFGYVYNNQPAKNNTEKFPYTYNPTYEINKLLNAASILESYVGSKINLTDKETTLYNDALVYHIKCDTSEKIIVFGDFHGSFHTFYRHMKRLMRVGILDGGSFNLKDGYRIIFLGDILDRGQYAFEILRYIIKLMIANNTSSKLKVILNRGNHEHIGQYEQHGNTFKTEINKKNMDYELFRIPVQKLFKLCSSALILESDNSRIWLSHGGFPLVTLDKGRVGYYNYIDKISQSDDTIIYHSMSDYNIPEQIRWNDFISINERTPNIRNFPGSNTIKNITPYDVETFCRLNKIDFIIRGHQDYPYNSYILSEASNKPSMTFSRTDQRFILGYKLIDSLESSNDIYINKNYINDTTKRLAVKGPIAAINLHRNINVSKKFKVYPVITLSTNTDLDRPLVHDSFGIIKFNRNLINYSHKTEFNLIGGKRNKKYRLIK